MKKLKIFGILVPFALLSLLLLGGAAGAQGNDIIGFQVLSETRDQLIIRIDYYYSGNWGAAGWLSAEALNSWEPNKKFTYFDTQGCAFNNAANIGRNSMCMRIRIPEQWGNIQFRTDNVQVCLFSGVSPEKHCESFSYAKQWSR